MVTDSPPGIILSEEENDSKETLSMAENHGQGERRETESGLGGC